MKQLAGGKHMENDCFPRTLKFEMQSLTTQSQTYLPFPTLKPIRDRHNHVDEPILLATENQTGNFKIITYSTLNKPPLQPGLHR
jgi:hypothetical protein